MEDVLPHAHNFHIPPTSQLYVRYFVASLTLLYFLHLCDELLYKNCFPWCGCSSWRWLLQVETCTRN